MIKLDVFMNMSADEQRAMLTGAYDAMPDLLDRYRALNAVLALLARSETEAAS